ncbi:hypothetical protein BDP27DRAFT_1329744, partial [Rhodocollybia butyracea]
MHPAWVPQIFSVGYTMPSSYRPPSPNQRPEISEPFQLTPFRPPDREINGHNNAINTILPARVPSTRSQTSKTSRLSPSSSKLFSRSRLYSSTSASPATATYTPSSSSSRTRHSENTHVQSSPTSSLRRGFSFGSSHSRRKIPRSMSPSSADTVVAMPADSSDDELGLASASSLDTVVDSEVSEIFEARGSQRSPSPSISRPQTPTSRPSIGFVLGKLKSPTKTSRTTKKGHSGQAEQSEAWVIVDKVKPI